MAVLFLVAAYQLYLRGIAASRIGNGVKVIAPLRGYTHSVIYWWTPRAGTVCPDSSSTPTTSRIMSHHVFGEDWRETRFVQFMFVSEATFQGLRRHFPDLKDPEIDEYDESELPLDTFDPPHVSPPADHSDEEEPRDDSSIYSP
jgi:hypothetical protein